MLDKIKKALDILDEAWARETTADVQISANRAASNVLRPLLGRLGGAVDAPPPIIRHERKVYPCAGDAMIRNENRDSPHRITGFSNYYASPVGRIWSYRRGMWMKTTTRTGKPRVTLRRKGFQVDLSVAWLVLTTHDTGNIGGKIGTKLRYRDTNPMNCALSNLYWGIEDVASEG